MFDFENLVIEGGGAKGVCIGGTLKALNNYGILQKIKRYAGTSAGALVATMLAVGYTYEELNKLLLEFHMPDLLDDSFGITLDLYRMYNEFGFYKGDYLSKYIRNLIQAKLGNPDASFQDLYNTHSKDLIIIATNITKDKPVYFSRYLTPSMPISLIVRASMSLPFVYRPIIINNEIYCDGGISNNYPITVFDGNYPDDDMDSNFKTINNKTLGLKFMSDTEVRSKMSNTTNDIHNIVQYGTSLLDHLLNRIERSAMKIGYFERTITVPTRRMKTMDFDISLEKKIQAQKFAEYIAERELLYFKSQHKFPTIKSHNLVSSL